MLAEEDVPATVFVVMGSLDGGRPRWRPDDATPMLSWDEAGLLAHQGWEFGSHTITHRRLPALEPQALAEELAMSREEVRRRLGLEARSLSFPYGAFDAAVAAAASRVGDRCSVGTRTTRQHTQPSPPHSGSRG